MSETEGAAPAAARESLGGRLRAWLRALRRLPDRLLHPLRRKRARARVAAATAGREFGEPRGVRGAPGPPPGGDLAGGPADPAFRILVLCHGNICRSPYAAGALRRRLPPELRSRVVVESAGFIGPGRRPPPEALEVARERGVDLSAHVSAVVEAGAARRADLVLAMDPWQARAARRGFGVPGERVVLLGDMDPEPVDARTIPDPILQPREAFEATFARIDRCVAACASALLESLRRPFAPRP